MDEQNRYPYDSQGENGENQTPPSQDASHDTSSDSSNADTSQSWFGDYTQQPEHTRPIPSYQQQPPAPWSPGYTPPPTPPRTSRRGLTAAVLAGALVLGGAAGIGGAALYGAVTDDGSI